MRVLVVEDNALLRHHLAVQLRDMGHQVDAAEDAKEADYFLREHLPISHWWISACRMKMVCL